MIIVIADASAITFANTIENIFAATPYKSQNKYPGTETDQTVNETSAELFLLYILCACAKLIVDIIDPNNIAK